MMKIAIIGAGVSGLTTAYYLKKEIPAAEITIYEKEGEAGGNANTMFVDLPTPGGVKTRWADMGVNDFNKATYDHLVALWQELGIMDKDKKSDYCSPLLNNASFALSGTNYRYTVEENGKVVVPPGGLASQQRLQDGKDAFIKAISDWYKNAGDEERAPRTLVGEWANAEPKKFHDEFIHSNLYPRINGMYFSQEQNPQNVAPPSLMPLWMVAHYYILQEGYTESIQNGDDLETRQYFTGGSTRWLTFLADRLINRHGVDIQFGAAKLHVGRYKGRLTVYNGEVKRGDYDKVIFATHADDTLKIMDFKDTDKDPMIPALKAFTYDTSTAYVHQDSSYIPVNGDCNRTYNINIYDYSKTTAVKKWPYTITYIVNYHQHDNPLNKDPLFFITLNPYKGVPDKILKRTKTGGDAVATFKHCKLDVAAMNAQVDIDRMQLGKDAPARDFYYAGSFSIGAGLHEECVIKAQELAKKIAQPAYVSDQVYDFTGERHFAPQYIMNLINRKPKK